MSSSRFPGFDRLFSLGSTGSSRDFIADVDLGDVDPFAGTRGKALPKHVRARWAMGATKPGSVVWTRLVGPVLFDASIVEALETERVSGWQSYPVDLYGKSGEGLGEYRGLVVTGRCGPIQHDRGIRANKEYPGGLFPVVRGLFFDETSWDGSDVFMPADDSAWVFVTERARNVLLAKAKNLSFERLEDVERIPPS